MLAENNKIIDAWTIIHALVGFNLGSLIKSREFSYFLIVIYEFVENRYLIGPIFENDEGTLNIISDLLVGFGFYELGRKYKNKEIKFK